MRDIDWSSYASVYDMLLEINPAYQEIISMFQTVIQSWSIEPGALTADIGAGTGNYSILLAQSFPGVSVIHVDPSPAMNQRALEKAQSLGITNLKIQQASEDKFDIGAERLGALVSIHALYTFPDPADALNRMFKRLAPGGYGFLCNCGRMIDMNSWRRYIFYHSSKTHGVVKTIKLFWLGREIAKQNKNIREAQRNGVYWSHSHQEFCAAVAGSGFEVIESGICYRGYSDYAVVRKPHTGNGQ